MPCTTILVGRKASYDGSTLMARNEDAGGLTFDPKKFIVVKPSEQPRVYRAKLSKVKIELPENPMRYTAMPNAIPDEGIWGEAGFNTANVAMSETETITSNPRVQGADPCLKGEGIGEEDLLTIVLPYIRSAREGVERLGALITEYGTYEMNGIGFQDMQEIWWFESIGGHHWIAKRVPDDAYVVMPNQMGIEHFDLKDAFGEAKDHMCSADLIDWIVDNHLEDRVREVPAVFAGTGAKGLGCGDALAEVKVAYCDLTAEEKKAYLRQLEDFDTRAAFGSHADSDHSYNTPRAWYMGRHLNPTTYKWEGEGADYTPESDNIPWSFVPERPVTIEDIKYVLSSYYQGTEYNPYSKHADPLKKGMYRPIGVNRNNFLCITQLRPYVPAEIAAIQWIAEGSNAFNAIIPFYGNVNATPAYLRGTTKKVTTENFYWANRLIGCMADAHYATTAIHIERYQNAINAKGHAFLKEFDAEFLAAQPADAPAFLEDCNAKIADYLKTETYSVLDHVLYASSLEMHNSFSRADA